MTKNNQIIKLKHIRIKDKQEDRKSDRKKEIIQANKKIVQIAHAQHAILKVNFQSLDLNNLCPSCTPDSEKYLTNYSGRPLECSLSLVLYECFIIVSLCQRILSLERIVQKKETTKKKKKKKDEKKKLCKILETANKERKHQ